MKISDSLQEEILAAVSAIGTAGATITEIEKKVSVERHTLSKYLSFMQAHGLLYHRQYGKAKVWFINQTPIQQVLHSPPEKKTYAERVLSDICENLPNGLFILDKDLNVLFADHSMGERYGGVEGEPFYKAVLGLQNPMRIEKVVDIAWGKTDKADVEVRDRDGRALSIRASAMENPDKSLSIILIVDDITKRRAVEHEARKLAKVVEQTADMVMITDRDGTIEYVNEAFEKTSGYLRKEALGQKPNIVKSGRHGQKFYEDMWAQLLKGKPFRGVLVDKAKDGKLFYEQKTITPVYTDRKITHFVSTGKLLDESQVPKRLRS